MSSDGQSGLKPAYEAAFAVHRYTSRRARDCWIDLEIWLDALAGPLYAIKEDGGCDLCMRVTTNISAASTIPPRMRQVVEAIWVVAEEACAIERSLGNTDVRRWI